MLTSVQLVQMLPSGEPEQLHHTLSICQSFVPHGQDEVIWQSSVNLSVLLSKTNIRFKMMLMMMTTTNTVNIYETTSSVSDPKIRRSKGIAATRSMTNHPLK